MPAFSIAWEDLTQLSTHDFFNALQRWEDDARLINVVLDAAHDVAERRAAGRLTFETESRLPHVWTALRDRPAALVQFFHNMLGHPEHDHVDVWRELYTAYTPLDTTLLALQIWTTGVKPPCAPVAMMAALAPAHRMEVWHEALRRKDPSSIWTVRGASLFPSFADWREDEIAVGLMAQWTNEFWADRQRLHPSPWPRSADLDAALAPFDQALQTSSETALPPRVVALAFLALHRARSTSDTSDAPSWMAGFLPGEAERAWWVQTHDLMLSSRWDSTREALMTLSVASPPAAEARLIDRPTVEEAQRVAQALDQTMLQITAMASLSNALGEVDPGPLPSAHTQASSHNV